MRVLEGSCRFCGGNAHVLKCGVGVPGTMGFSGWWHIVRCMVCHAQAGSPGDFTTARTDDEQSALDAWFREPMITIN